MSTGFGKGLLVLALVTASAARAEDTNWVTQSNANAAPLLEVMARYAPETAAAFGVEGHDSEVLDLEPGYDTRFEADLAQGRRASWNPGSPRPPIRAFARTCRSCWRRPGTRATRRSSTGG